MTGQNTINRKWCCQFSSICLRVLPYRKSLSLSIYIYIYIYIYAKLISKTLNPILRTRGRSPDNPVRHATASKLPQELLKTGCRMSCEYELRRVNTNFVHTNFVHKREFTEITNFVYTRTFSSRIASVQVSKIKFNFLFPKFWAESWPETPSIGFGSRRHGIRQCFLCL